MYIVVEISPIKGVKVRIQAQFKTTATPSWRPQMRSQGDFASYCWYCSEIVVGRNVVSGLQEVPQPSRPATRFLNPDSIVSSISRLLTDQAVQLLGDDFRYITAAAFLEVTKPKPRWDVHLPGAGNPAGVLRLLIAGLSGSAVSLRPAGWTARPGICRPSPAPLHWFPGTGCPWPPLSPIPRRGLIGIEVWAVSREVHQPKAQAGRPQVLPHRLAIP